MVMECGQRVKVGEGDLSTLGALALGYHEQHMYIILAFWHEIMIYCLSSMCKYISNFYIGTQAFPSQN